MNSHLNTDQLIDQVYGLAQSSHLAVCRECAGQLKSIDARRRVSAGGDEPSGEFLAAQRRRIYSRIEQPQRRLRWLPAVAAAGVLAIVGLVSRPAAVPAARSFVHSDAATDTQLFSEVYSMEQSIEPQAAAPIHELFEENGQ